MNSDRTKRPDEHDDEIGVLDEARVDTTAISILGTPAVSARPPVTRPAPEPAEPLVLGRPGLDLSSGGIVIELPSEEPDDDSDVVSGEVPTESIGVLSAGHRRESDVDLPEAEESADGDDADLAETDDERDDAAAVDLGDEPEAIDTDAPHFSESADRAEDEPDETEEQDASGASEEDEPVSIRSRILNPYLSVLSAFRRGGSEDDPGNEAAKDESVQGAEDSSVDHELDDDRSDDDDVDDVELTEDSAGDESDDAAVGEGNAELIDEAEAGPTDTVDDAEDEDAVAESDESAEETAVDQLVDERHDEQPNSDEADDVEVTEDSVDVDADEDEESDEVDEVDIDLIDQAEAEPIDEVDDAEDEVDVTDSDEPEEETAVDQVTDEPSDDPADEPTTEPGDEQPDSDEAYDVEVTEDSADVDVDVESGDAADDEGDIEPVDEVEAEPIDEVDDAEDEASIAEPAEPSDEVADADADAEDEVAVSESDAPDDEPADEPSDELDNEQAESDKTDDVEAAADRADITDDADDAVPTDGEVELTEEVEAEFTSDVDVPEVEEDPTNEPAATSDAPDQDAETSKADTGVNDAPRTTKDEGNLMPAPTTPVEGAPRRADELARQAERRADDQLTADRLIDTGAQTTREPEGGWRLLLHRLSGGLINLGESPKGRAHREMTERIAVDLPGSARFVPVLSRKGGVGKTTVTALLGMALADAREDRVIAVDANPDRGTLAERIERRGERTVRDLVRNRDQVRGYADMSDHVVRDQTRLDVLASDADPMVSEAFSDSDYRDVAAVAGHYYSLVLTDTGTGIVHSVMGATLDLADQLVIVTGLSIDEARLASETLTWLESNGYADIVTRAVVVLNQSNPGTPLVRQDELEAHFRSRVRAVVRLPYDTHLATGSSISYTALSEKTRLAARELAAAVVEGLRGN